jgi:hypothetical protein
VRRQPPGTGPNCYSTVFWGRKVRVSPARSLAERDPCRSRADDSRLCAPAAATCVWRLSLPPSCLYSSLSRSPFCSRAAEGERIHAAALEEYRVREAEAQRTAQMAAEAKAIFDRAEAAFKQAEQARNHEVSAAEKTAEVARAAEAALQQSATVEASTSSRLAGVHQQIATTPAPRSLGYGYAM